MWYPANPANNQNLLGPWGTGRPGGPESSHPVDHSGPSYPSPVDYSDAMTVSSDNSKTVALAQITGQEFAIQQASLDRELQAAATLEQQLEGFDTKLQISNLDFRKSMTEEGNRHTEKLAELAARHALMEGGGTTQSSPDLPMPDFA